MMHSSVQKVFVLSLLIIASLIVTHVSYQNEISNSTNEDISKVQRYILNTEAKAVQTISESLYRADFDSNEITLINFRKENDFTTLVFQKNELTYWSNNNLALPTNTNNLKEGSNLVRLKNYWADVYKVSKTKENFVLFVIPIKYIYDIRNAYLTNHFAAKNISNDLAVSDKNTLDRRSLHGGNGEFLFSLLHTSDTLVIPQNLFFVLIDCLIYLFIFYIFYTIAVFVRKKYSIVGSVVLLGTFLVCLRLLFSSCSVLPYLQSSAPFDPKYFASSYIFPSLGIMALNLSSLLLFVFYLVRHVKMMDLKSSKPAYLLLISASYIFIYFLQIPIFTTIQSLVIDSVISFELNNLFSLDYISFLGFFLIFLLLLIYYFISVKVFQFSIQMFHQHSTHFFLMNFLSFIVFIVSNKLGHFSLNYYIPALWTFCWICILWYNNRTTSIFPKTFSTVISIAFFSLLSVFYLNSLLTQKAKLNAEIISLKLSDDRDYVAEFSFTDIHCRITDDNYVKSTFLSHSVNHKTLVDRIKLLYFKGYLNKFDIEIHSFDKHGISAIENDTIGIQYYDNIIKKYGFETSDVYLRYIQDPSQNYYSSIIPVFSDTSLTGNFVIILRPRSKDITNVYPELLLSKGLQKVDDLKNGNYVVYNNGKILKSKGSIQIEKVQDVLFTLPVDSFCWQEHSNSFILSYKPTILKSIVLSIPKRTIIQYVTTYSYLFSLATIFIILLNFLNLIRWIFVNLKDNKFKKLTIPFHDRISYTLMSLLAFSFFAVAIITTIYFTYQYNEDNMQTISSRSKKIQNEIQDDIRSGDSVSDVSMIKEKLLYDIPALADNEQIDINIYDKEGNMIVTSQLSIFEKGLLSYKIHPVAFNDLLYNKTNQVVQKESIGKLSYISTYLPINNENGQTIGYINIPFFGQTQYLKENISRFIIALVNVYVPLLLITGLLGLFIANSLTKPLAEIGERLRKVVLGKRNETIVWKRDDEIGLLVKEYNKMIVKLEDAASNLAKSEREGAWQEMAKQIAHEIKNPLTPMKLSIQYLQRALLENSPNTRELTQRMSDTLIEQIDNLSEIATAFSSFAQMPTANNEVINIEHYIKSIIDLFNDSEEIKISFNGHDTPLYIFADKNQMISVFNNIIKNATQARHADKPCIIDITILKEVETVKIVVKDNGIGIPDDVKASVFVPNFTTKNSGSGLGLAISKQIIEGANGHIWFESEPNLGTTFFVTLPMHIIANNNIDSDETN